MLDESNLYYHLYPRNPNRTPDAAYIIPDLFRIVQNNGITDEKRIKDLYNMLYLTVKYPKDVNDKYWRGLQKIYLEFKDKYTKIKNKEDKARAERSPIHINNTTTPDLLADARKQLNQSYEYCSKIYKTYNKEDLSNVFELFNTLSYSTQSFPQYFNDVKNTNLVREVLQFKNEQYEMLATVGEWCAVIRQRIDDSDLAYIKSLDAKQGGRRRQKSRSVLMAKYAASRPRSKSKGRRSKSKGRPGRKK
jgi:hypothetical protein